MRLVNRVNKPLVGQKLEVPFVSGWPLISTSVSRPTTACVHAAQSSPGLIQITTDNKKTKEKSDEKAAKRGNDERNEQ